MGPAVDMDALLQVLVSECLQGEHEDRCVQLLYVLYVWSSQS